MKLTIILEMPLKTSMLGSKEPWLRFRYARRPNARFESRIAFHKLNMALYKSLFSENSSIQAIESDAFSFSGHLSAKLTGVVVERLYLRKNESIIKKQKNDNY